MLCESQSKMKCDQVAESFSLKADECLSNKKYAEALENYNQCLRFAENKSRLLSGIFAKRSRVFYEVQQFKKCLENIQSAIEVCDSEIKCNEFQTIREECREKVKNIASDESDNDTWSFFKLSRAPHKRIPFIADCLEVRENEVYGRYIMTTKDLNPGEIVVLEEPFYKVLDTNQRNIRCAICLKQNMMNLFPCAKCDGETVIDFSILLIRNLRCLSFPLV